MRVKREEAARYGLTPGDVTELLETAFKGRTVSQVIEEDKYFSLVVWYDEASGYCAALAFFLALLAAFFPPPPP